MKKRTRIILIVAAYIAVILFGIGYPIADDRRPGEIDPEAAATSTVPIATSSPAVPEPEPIEIPKPKAYALSAEQEAWIDDLQYCESRNNPAAINHHDRDGTPSYYAFQFKPGTFRSFGEAYRVIPKGLSHDELMEAIKRTDLQRAIVARMITDPSIRWSQQFPDCTQIYIGLPPGAASVV